MTIEQAKERIFDKCNLIGENVNIWDYIYKYKATRELDDAQQEEIYDDIAVRLGFTR